MKSTIYYILLGQAIEQKFNLDTEFKEWQALQFQLAFHRCAFTVETTGV